MGTYRFSANIGAPADRVFGVFTDFGHAPENISAIKRLEVLTDGPIGRGTRFRETRDMFGREATEEMEITDFRPGESYSVGCDSCGARWDSTFTFEEEGGGTRVALVMQCRPVSLGAKLISPLGFLFAGMMKKCVRKDLEELKALCEGRAGGAREAQPA